MGIRRSSGFFRAFGALAVTMGVGVLGTSWASASSTQPVAAPGSLLTNTALGGYSELGQIDMLSSTLGYALAYHPLTRDRYAYFLVRTTNLAKTWTVVGHQLFADGYYPNLDDQGAFDSDPPIDFVTREVGYVAGPRGIIYMTVNAGSSWRRIASSNGYGVSSSTLSLVNTRCKPAGSPDYACVNTLDEYRVGSNVLEGSWNVPATTSQGERTALLAVAPGPIQVLDRDSDGDSTRASLLLTRNGGVTWENLSNPCAGELIEQMAVASDGEWLLSCFHDYGMSQGPAKIFRSMNQGTTWSTVENEVHGTSIYYFFNGNDRVLYGASTNPAGGLSYSPDGGLKWAPLLRLGNTGGASESIVNFGPTSSIYQINQGPMFVTRNDRTWNILPPLPAGNLGPVSICTERTVDVHFRRYRSGRSHYEYIDFTNVAGHSCYLDGAPVTQPVSSSGTDVGPSISLNSYNVGGDFVVLKAHGGRAHVDFQINPTSSYARVASCRARRARAVRIEFAPTSHFRVSLGTTPVSFCSTFPSVFTSPVSSGFGHVPSY